MTADGAKFRVSAGPTKRRSGPALTSPEVGWIAPPASFSSSLTPDPFSPIIPMMAPDGAFAVNPFNGEDTTFRNSMDIYSGYVVWCGFVIWDRIPALTNGAAG